MSTTSELDVVMLGLKGTGKTYFLTALDVVLDDHSDPDRLEHIGMADNLSYLQPLREQWLRGDELGRTSLQTQQGHQFILRHAASGTRVNLYVPDLAGETFERYFDTRTFPEEFCATLKSSSGLLLFLHSESEGRPELLEAPSLMDEQAASNTSPTSSTGSNVPPWSMEQASRQCKVVDLLQFVEEVGSVKPVKVAVILSAWDVVERMRKELANDYPNDPDKLLALRWPLLNQFLATRSDLFTFRVFGVSARGGGSTREEIERIKSISNASDRVRIVDGGHSSNDLSRPIRWILGLLNDHG